MYKTNIHVQRLNNPRFLPTFGTTECNSELLLLRNTFSAGSSILHFGEVFGVSVAL